MNRYAFATATAAALVAVTGGIAAARAVGKSGKSMQGHGRAPHRHFSYEFGPHCEVQPFATATARTVQL